MNRRLEIVAELLGAQGVRMDSTFNSAFIDQELESVEQAAYKVEYEDLKLRLFVPKKSDVNEGAETFSFKIWDVFGQADWISSYSEDLPESSIRVRKVSGKIEGIGNAYSYSVQDLRAAAMANVALDREEAEVAARVHEEKVDEAGSLGDSSRQFFGFCNHPDVSVISATADWDSATGEQMLLDLHRMAMEIVEQTKGKIVPDTILLPLNKYNIISRKAVNTAGSTRDTVLDVFLAQTKFVKRVEWFNRLVDASETGAERALCYKYDPTVVQLVIPMEMIQHEPERRGLRYRKALESRFGGVIVRKPLGMIYMDGV
jgi:hypothetical protein